MKTKSERITPGADTRGPGVGKDFDPRQALMRGALAMTCAYAFKDEPGEELETIRTEFTSTMEEIKSAVAKRDEEVKALGEARKETGAEIKELDEKLSELAKNYEGLLTEHETLVEEHKGLMVRSQRHSHGGPDADVKSIGEMLTESDSYERMLKANALHSDAVQVPSLLKMQGELQHKTLTTGTGSGAALIDPFRVPGIFADPVRQFRLRDLMVVNNTNERSVEYVEETNFYHLYTQLAADAAVTQPDIVVDNAAGFYAGQTITIAPGQADEETKVISSISGNTITLTTNLANAHTTDTEVIADDFVFTPEATLKPRTDVTFALQTEAMKTLAHWLPASRQVLRNRAMLRQHIDTRLLQGLRISEEKQILYGDGSSNQIQGVMTHADAQSYLWSSGTVGDTKLDAIRRAMTLSQLAHYPVDGVVLNPSDWEDIELAKGTDDHYIWVNVASGGGMTVWRAPVVVTTAIKAGDFLVGAFGLGTAIWDGEQASVRVSEHHEDFFAKNMVAILAEQDMVQTIYRPESFVVGDFDSAPV